MREHKNAVSLSVAIIKDGCEWEVVTELVVEAVEVNHRQEVAAARRRRRRKHGVRALTVRSSGQHRDGETRGAGCTVDSGEERSVQRLPKCQAAD